MPYEALQFTAYVWGEIAEQLRETAPEAAERIQQFVTDLSGWEQAHITFETSVFEQVWEAVTALNYTDEEGL